MRRSNSGAVHSALLDGLTNYSSNLRFPRPIRSSIYKPALASTGLDKSAFAPDRIDGNP